MSLHKKWSFPLKISSVNVTRSAVSDGYGHIYWRNPWWKTSFFVQCVLFVSISLFLSLFGWFRAKWNTQKLKHVRGILMFPSWKYDFFIMLINILQLNQPIANESILAAMYIIFSTDNNWCLTQNWFGSKKLFVGNLFWGYLEIVSLGNFF